MRMTGSPKFVRVEASHTSAGREYFGGLLSCFVLWLFQTGGEIGRIPERRKHRALNDRNNVLHLYSSSSRISGGLGGWRSTSNIALMGYVDRALHTFRSISSSTFNINQYSMLTLALKRSGAVRPGALRTTGIGRPSLGRREIRESWGT